MQYRLPVLLVAPLLAVLAACGTVTAQAAPQPIPSSPAPEQSYWPGQEALMDASNRVDEVAPDRWPAAYAGVALDLPGGRMLVYRVPTAGMDAAVRALVPAVLVDFVDATYSAAKLEEWAAKVRDDQAFWQHRGVTVHGVGTDFGRCVTVGLADPQRDGGKVVARYPKAALCVEQGYASDPLTAN
ncbi:hypothetical protein ACN261_25835 [Micromonospora sp. WMMD723]|jgi:hypothetical protein|uniref:hypothetical protein n=1 Tax=unclassified Micromonospora TaxID=2617518 RepID=UPI003B96309B